MGDSGSASSLSFAYEPLTPVQSRIKQRGDFWASVVSTDLGETEPLMLTETVVATDKPLDTEFAKS